MNVSPENLLKPAFVGIESIFSVFLISVNALQFFIFYLGLPTLKLQQICVISLILSDFLFGLLAIPICISLFLGYPKNFFGCLSILSFYLALETLETLCILLNLLERYFSKLYPMKYIIHATGRRTNGMKLYRKVLQIEIQSLFRVYRIVLCSEPSFGSIIFLFTLHDASYVHQQWLWKVWVFVENYCNTMLAGHRFTCL